MNIKKLIFEALDKSSRDISIEDGVFDITKQEHIEILRGNLLEVGMSVETVTDYLNKVVEGKFPERQAYNKNGILVTFPTPEYKQKAIAKGTHFDKNPMKGDPNVFADDPTTQEKPKAEPQQKPTPDQPKAPDSPAAKTDEKPKDGEEQDTRTPQEKQADAAEVEKILRTEYTLEEANSFGFYQKKNTWYDSNGNVVGKLWYVDGKQLIIK
jgi:outer membrane biosynthesis protein TonB